MYEVVLYVPTLEQSALFAEHMRNVSEQPSFGIDTLSVRKKIRTGRSKEESSHPFSSL